MSLTLRPIPLPGHQDNASQVGRKAVTPIFQIWYLTNDFACVRAKQEGYMSWYGHVISVV